MVKSEAKTDIDMEKLSPVLATLVRIAARREGVLSTIIVTVGNVNAVRDDMLKLAKEIEKMRPKANAYDLACATEKECRLPKDLAARKGDAGE